MHIASKSCILLYWQHYCMTLEHCTSTKLCSVSQGRELENFRCSFVPPVFCRAAITLSVGPHSSYFVFNHIFAIQCQIWQCLMIILDIVAHLQTSQQCLYCSASSTLHWVLWHCWLGIRKSIQPVRNCVMRCWCGCLSGVRCRSSWCHCDPVVSCKWGQGIVPSIPCWSRACKWVGKCLSK